EPAVHDRRSGRSHPHRQRRAVGGARRLFACGSCRAVGARLGDDGDGAGRRDRGGGRRVRAGPPYAGEDRGCPGSRGRADAGRGAHPDVRHRHRALGGGRPGPRRGLRRHPAGHHDGAGRRPHRPRHAGRDRGGRGAGAAGM
ncbi:MAG: RidA/YER057c/UK114 superfamily, group 6, partial [uncultured Gemmatimonadetes bacterium]